MSNVVTLQDTKIVIEIEAIRQPEASKEGSETTDYCFPYSIQTTVRVGDRKLGHITKLSVNADIGNEMPLIEIDLMGGAKPLRVELPPTVKEHLAEMAQALRQFPFVQVNVPTKPIV